MIIGPIDLRARLTEATIFIKEMEKELNKLRWRPVSKGLPRIGKDMQSKWVRVTDGKIVVEGYRYDYTKRKIEPGDTTNYNMSKGWSCHGIQKEYITHWQYITLLKKE